MTRGRGIAATIAVAVLALLLRLHHLDWALPHTYEEATPLRIAFRMWGWDRGIDVDLNPGFFNYPSLVLYLHFIVQGALYGVLQLTGRIHSVADWQVMYLVDPTAIYVVGRLVTVFFAVGTVLATALLGRLVGGWLTGIIAALLLACNSFHIGQSQMIEVDVPLAFFATVSLWIAARVAHSTAPRNYVLAGVAIGLAMSSKYTGLFLAVPLVVAHVLRNRGLGTQRLLWMALGIMALVFVATSPFVVIDFRRFWADFMYERSHMAEGHFGLLQSSSAIAYAKALFGRVVSAPLALSALAGIALLVFRGRSRAGVVLLSFLVIYLAAISVWKMRADRYLMPVLPLLAVFAAAPLAALLAWKGPLPRLRQAVAILAVLALIAIDYDRRAKVVDSLHYDARTEATEWLEANIPAGAFILTEHYGPELMAPSVLLQLEPPLRARVLSEASRPVYATQLLPMTQTDPEQSAPFYSLALYPNADYVITSRAVRGRYEREPTRFPAHLAFYDWLAAHTQKLKDFGTAGGTGPDLTVYQLPMDGAPFGLRESLPPPPILPPDAMTADRQASFYYQLGANYEYFGHNHEAYVCYVRALDRSSADRDRFMHCVLGAVRTLLSNGQLETALQALDRLAEVAPDRDARLKVLDMRRQLAERSDP